jgi:hypothetical protein
MLPRLPLPLARESELVAHSEQRDDENEDKTDRDKILNGYKMGHG